MKHGVDAFQNALQIFLLCAIESSDWTVATIPTNRGQIFEKKILGKSYELPMTYEHLRKILQKTYESPNFRKILRIIVRETYQTLATTERLSYKNFCQQSVCKQNEKMALLCVMNLSRQQVSSSLRLNEL